ncbi:uncharacterized protein LOC119165774 isoform X2 [Rhipicephalus microplus]|uniref:uncharacterized protein LOC119165774 isoform X2 n=1 Tax=Rhipicephalus microplus TaxID=6941 RepID=UPI003F6D2A59
MTDSPIGHLRIGMASRRARCRPDSANSSANSSASVIREVDMSQPMESAARNGVRKARSARRKRSRKPGMPRRRHPTGDCAPPSAHRWAASALSLSCWSP